MNPGIILQARLTGDRCPNKVLAQLMGKPVLQWTIEAILKTKLPWVLAVPDGIANDGINSWIKEYANRTGIRVRMYSGENEDVTTRFIEANKVAKFDPIIRICADSPFVAPEDIKLALKIFEERKYFTMLNHVQVFSQSELIHAFKNDWMIRSREHAGARFMHHTVDYPEDFHRLSTEWHDGSPTMDGRKRLWQVD